MGLVYVPASLVSDPVSLVSVVLEVFPYLIDQYMAVFLEDGFEPCQTWQDHVLFQRPCFDHIDSHIELGLVQVEQALQDLRVVVAGKPPFV